MLQKDCLFNFKMANVNNKFEYKIALINNAGVAVLPHQKKEHMKNSKKYRI